ncbi:Alpha/Beta hydrolase protein [Naviculisporaceae sp. PSN 640]
MATPLTYTLPSGTTISYHLSHPTDPARPTVLLSNSLSSQFSFWDHIVTQLHALNFRVLRYDHPGHGQSGVPSDLSSTTFDSLAEDVHCLITSPDLAPCFTGKHSPDVKSFTPALHAWIGVSMGAALGIVFATKYPGVVKRLVVCDTISCSPVNAGGADAFGPRVKAARESGSMQTAVRETMERWFGTEWIEKNPEEAGRVKSLMGQTTLDGFETCIAALRSNTFDLRPLFGKVGSSVERVLLVVGEKDADLPAQMAKMKEEVQKGSAKEVELKVIKEAGHVCFIDGKDEFLKVVLPFLEK